MNTPLLSVIVPVYNVQDYLSQCVDSILNQSYNNLEVILVDDGSTDACGAICDEYALRDKRVRVIHKPNGGLSSARNAGMEIMTGAFVSFVDSDDWIDLDAYEVCMRAFDNNASLVQVRFRFETYDNDTAGFYSDGWSSEAIVSGSYSSQAFLEHFVKGDLLALVCTSVYRSATLQGFRFLEGRYHEDEYFTLALLCLRTTGTTLQLPDSFYKYRRGRPDSITSHKREKHYRDLIEGFLETFKFVKERASLSLSLSLSLSYCVQYIRFVITSRLREFRAHYPYFAKSDAFVELLSQCHQVSPSLFTYSPYSYYMLIWFKQAIARRVRPLLSK